MTLEKTVNIAILALVVLMAGLAIHNQIATPGRPIPPVDLVGKPWPGTEKLQFGEKATVVLALQTRCHYCNESMDFYRQLASLRNASVVIDAIFPQSAEEGQSHLAGYSVAVDQVLHSSSLPFVQGTPTLFLIGSDKKIKNVWTGKLYSMEEKQILQTLAP